MWVAIACATLVAFLLFKYLKKDVETFWKNLGVRFIDTSPGAGKFELLIGRKGIMHTDTYAYKQIGSDKCCGVSDMGTPVLLIKDLELLKRILIKDFDHFVDRREFFTEADQSLHKMLFSLQGDEWKGVRNSVSPTFTTGKIRRMMEYFNGVGKEWVDVITEKAQQNNDGSYKVDILNSVNQYTIDVIASAVFGMDVGTIRNPDSKFYKLALKLSDVGLKQIIKFMMMMQFPNVFKFLRLPFIDRDVLGFFEKILDQGLKQRMNGTVKRNDFLQLLVEAKKGELKAEGNDELSAFEKEALMGSEGSHEKKQYLTDEVMNAQSLAFFFAGFSTTSNFITWAMYVMSAHQDIQDKLRTELKKIMKEDGSMDYDELNQLVYLDMVVCEVLRKYPGVGRLERMCVKDYKDEETGVFIPKGTLVGVPVDAIHHDSQYYENPDKFNPENFTPDKKTERNPYCYLPFGIGPRNCIGMRFALVESKAAIAHLVHNFVVEPTEKTPLPVRGRPAGFQMATPKNLELKFTPVQN